MTTLASNFTPTVQEPLPAAPKPGRKVYKTTPERVLPEAERQRRARAWYAKHYVGEPVNCGDAWPPIPIR